MPSVDTVKFGVLNFIEQTKTFEDFMLPWAFFDQRHGNKVDKCLEELATSKKVINETIQGLGGLVVTINGNDEQLRQQFRVGAWLGADPTNPNNIKWLLLGGEGEISVGAEAINEMKDALLTDALDKA